MGYVQHALGWLKYLNMFFVFRVNSKQYLIMFFIWTECMPNKELHNINLDVGYVQEGYFATNRNSFWTDSWVVEEPNAIWQATITCVEFWYVLGS